MMEATPWKEIQAFITGAGFSVFVAVWFLLKTDKTLERLTRAVEKLADKLNGKDA